MSKYSTGCLTPITLVRTYKSINGDFTNIVPCGSCVSCLRRRASGWSFRIQKQMEISTSACFLTLTYENPPLSFNGYPTLVKKDYQLFMKRLRKTLPNRQFKYYACGEYGELNNRPHYHAILMNLPLSWIHHDSTKLADVWGLGHIDIGTAEIGSINYTTQYVMKGKYEPFGELDDRDKPFSLMSKKMGLNYLTPSTIKHHKSLLKSYITLPGGIPTSLPRYFRDKIFTKEERIKINEAQAQARALNMNDYLNYNFKLETEWKKQKIKQTEKMRKASRLTV